MEQGTLSCSNTHLKFNKAPEKLPSQKDNSDHPFSRAILKLPGCTYSRLRKVRRRSMEFERDEVSDEVSEWPLGRYDGKDGKNGTDSCCEKKRV